MATDDKVSIILTSTNTSGAVKQKSFTYISPDATNGQLKAFAQAANALTENTYNGSKKVTQVDLDTADPGQQKQEPNLSLAVSSASISQLPTTDNGGAQGQINTDSDGALTVGFEKIEKTAAANILYHEGNPWLGIYKRTTGTAADIVPQTVTIYQAETDTYKAASVTFTITA